MLPVILAIVYCALIVVASLLGGWLPSLVRLTHTRMQLVMSFVSGLMLGIALLHLLPHAVEFVPLNWALAWMMVGLLGMFFLIRIFAFHQHPAPENGEDQHDHKHDDEHDHHHGHGHGHGSKHRVSWAGLAFGLALHTMIDGVALGVSIRADWQHADTFALLGLGTFLAIALHKPLDAMSITSLMSAGGWSAKGKLIVNAGFALMCPLGVVLFWLMSSQVVAEENSAIGCALAFSAGVFLCISLGDLLPEVHFHRHDRVKLSIALLLGVALAVGIEQLPGHSHDAHETAPAEEDDPHAGHNH